MRSKVFKKVIQFCADEPELKRIAWAKNQFGLASDSEAVRFLIRNPYMSEQRTEVDSHCPNTNTAYTQTQSKTFADNLLSENITGL